MLTKAYSYNFKKHTFKLFCNRYFYKIDCCLELFQLYLLSVYLFYLNLKYNVTQIYFKQYKCDVKGDLNSKPVRTK